MKKIFIIGALSAGLLIVPFSFAAQKNFSDIHEQHLNKEAIEYLQANKVIEGYKDGTYKAENRINRAEFVKILIESQIQNPSGSFCFDDVKDEWFAPYVCTAKRLGYIKGYSDNTFKPGQNINFAEASKIITKILGITPDETGTNREWFAGFVNSLAKKKAIPTTIHFFNRDISRGEMAEIIWRVKEEKTNKISQSYEGLTEAFPKLESCSALKDQFNNYQSYHHYRGFDDVMFLEDAAVSRAESVGIQKSSAESAANESSSDFSTTNIQVEGVDEADIIKNDGKYIYLIKKNTVRIINAFPVEAMEEVGEITFKDENFNPRELFLNKDQLVIVGQTWKNISAKRIGFAPIRDHSRTKVYMVNVEDRTKPVIENQLSFEGNYHTSRRIDNQMMLVLNQYPDFWAWDQVLKGEDLLPQYEDRNGATKKLVDCDDIRYFPGYARPNYLIVANITLDKIEEPETEVFLGSSENVYSSTKNLYVAANEFNYEYYTDWNWENDRMKTSVYQFDITNGKVEFKNKGSVPGQILNQFSMDENKNHFRIATTTNQWNNEKSASHVFVLDDTLTIKGKIEDIAPGERIFSTRFLGDRLYMVTFRQVDPLFVIDLKNPIEPRILGKLKIPGFSDYLHPFDENHIIGFGKDTEVNEKDRVLTRGFKMALFDVSDVTKPKQKFSEIIGDRGTDSELLRNHKALLFNASKELLAFPIRIMEKVEPETLECSKKRYDTCPSLCQKRCIPTSCTVDDEGRAICTEDCNGLGSCTDPSYDRYQTTFSGALVYRLNLKDGFTQRAKITHYESADINKMGDYWPYNHEKNIKRMLYIGDNLYSISESKVKANDLQDLKEVNQVKLD